MRAALSSDSTIQAKNEAIDKQRDQVKALNGVVVADDILIEELSDYNQALKKKKKADDLWMLGSGGGAVVAACFGAGPAGVALIGSVAAVRFVVKKVRARRSLGS